MVHILYPQSVLECSFRKSQFSSIVTQCCVNLLMFAHQHEPCSVSVSLSVSLCLHISMDFVGCLCLSVNVFAHRYKPCWVPVSKINLWFNTPAPTIKYSGAHDETPVWNLKYILKEGQATFDKEFILPVNMIFGGKNVVLI